MIEILNKDDFLKIYIYDKMQQDLNGGLKFSAFNFHLNDTIVQELIQKGFHIENTYILLTDIVYYSDYKIVTEEEWNNADIQYRKKSIISWN